MHVTYSCPVIHVEKEIYDKLSPKMKKTLNGLLHLISDDDSYLVLNAISNKYDALLWKEIEYALMIDSLVQIKKGR